MEPRPSALPIGGYTARDDVAGVVDLLALFIISWKLRLLALILASGLFWIVGMAIGDFWAESIGVGACTAEDAHCEESMIE